MPSGRLVSGDGRQPFLCAGEKMEENRFKIRKKTAISRRAQRAEAKNIDFEPSAGQNFVYRSKILSTAPDSGRQVTDVTDIWGKR